LSRVTDTGVVDPQGCASPLRVVTSNPCSTLNWRGLIRRLRSRRCRSRRGCLRWACRGPQRAVHRRRAGLARRDRCELRELEGLARLNKQVLGIGSPYPVTLERISAWAATLQEKGIALAPVTAVLEGKPQG
jgi:hypothetical protein